jgi:hypothetical protein
MNTVGEQVLNTGMICRYKPNKKTRTQYTTNNTHENKSDYISPNTTYNIQYGLSNSQGQGLTTGDCRGYLISGEEITQSENEVSII